jgi:hypothetical protein
MPHLGELCVDRAARRGVPRVQVIERVARLLALAALTTILLVAAAGCGGVGGRAYEYEEVLDLALDGSATLYVNGSVPALVALRGLDLDVSPRARLDRAALRAAYESPITRVTRVGSSRRAGRRFAHLRIEVDDVRGLGEVKPLSWSTYQFQPREDAMVFTQSVGGSARREVGNVGWTGAELVGFRLHLPSKIHYHNAPSKQVGRGNFLAWEQPLRTRLAGEPISMEARLDTRTILYRTLWLFGGMILLVLALFAGVIAWIVRSGREPALPAAPSGVAHE